MPCRVSRAAAYGRSTRRGWGSNFIRKCSSVLMRLCGCRSYSGGQACSPREGDQWQTFRTEAADREQAARVVLALERGRIAAERRRGDVESVQVSAAELTAGREVDRHGDRTHQ